MESTCSPIICFMMLVVSAAVHSLPTGRREAPPTADQEIAVNEFLLPLITITEDSNNLYSLWQAAFNLADENLLNAEFQHKKRKVCRGRVFYEMTGQEEKCGEKTTLTYGQLYKYYNELVVQLKLAQTIGVSSLIAREVVEAKQAEVLETEKRIIQLLNETVLPVLQFTLQHQLAANGTDCSTTEAIVNQTTAIYTNCAAVQTSNLFLAQTALDLFFNLRYTIKEIADEDSADNGDGSSVTLPTDSKEWCIIQQ